MHVACIRQGWTHIPRLAPEVRRGPEARRGDVRGRPRDKSPSPETKSETALGAFAARGRLDLAGVKSFRLNPTLARYVRQQLGNNTP